MIRLITASIAVLGLGVTLLNTAQGKPASGRGSFTAKLELKALKNEKTGRTPQLPFSGSYAHSGGRFRMEIVNELTTETQILIMDSTVKQGWMLFPDTLNGITANLAQFDQKGLVSQAQGFMSGDYGAVPKDWSKPSTKQTTLNGAPVTELSYSLPQKSGAGGKPASGGTVTLWHRADKTPVKLVFDSSAMKLTADFSGVTQGGSIADSQFKPGEKYKLRELGKGEAPPLPGGIPGGFV